MSHRAPRVGGIRPEVCCTIFANLEARCLPFYCDVDYAFFIPGGLDCVCVACLVHFHSHILGIKTVLRLVETVVLERVGAELMLSRSIMVEDLAVKLGRGVDAAIGV